MSKKKKIIVRIVCALLCVLMLLGTIIPYVSATEVPTDEKTGTEENVSNEGMPTAPLPVGFEYVKTNNTWHVARAEGNDDAAVMLHTGESKFDQPVVTIFVGNLETHEVESFNLYYAKSYVASLPLEDGYYVIFANDYAWKNSEGYTYAINDGEFQYIYVGEDESPDKYGIEFQHGKDIFNINLGKANEKMQVIEYNTVLEVKDSDLKYPNAAKLEAVKDGSENEYKQPDEDGQQSSEDDDAKDKEEKKGFFAVIGGFLSAVFKDSGLVIILIAVLFVVLKIVEKKKRDQLAKQSEEDQLDDSIIK